MCLSESDKQLLLVVKTRRLQRSEEALEVTQQAQSVRPPGSRAALPRTPTATSPSPQWEEIRRNKDSSQGQSQFLS